MANLERVNQINAEIARTGGIAPSALSSPIVSKPPVSSAVITSKPAQTDVNNIQSRVNEINTNISNQATSVSNAKATADANAKAMTEKANADKLAADKLAIDKQGMQAKITALGGKVDEAVGAGYEANDEIEYDANGKIIPKRSAERKLIDSANEQKQIAEEEYQRKAKEVSSTIERISGGIIPLNAGEQAQVQGLQQAFGALIQQQQLQNTASQGEGNIRGYQTGAGEYDPSFQVKTIGSIVTAGINKVADLNVKMASAVADLTDKFKQNKISEIKDAWNMYQDASEKRTKALQKTVDDTQKAITDAQKDHYDRVQKPIDEIMTLASKNGADSKTLSAISNSKNLQQALESAGDYAQGGTGIVGEYQYYKRQAEQMGQVPMDFNSYQNVDANRKAKVASAGLANGLSNATLGKVQQVAGQFDGESIVKNYNTIAEQINYIKTLGNNPTDDIARVYAFAKVADPSSSVREGEYKTVQDYSTSLLQKTGLNAKRIFNNSGFLTDEARNFIENTLDKRLSASEKTYKNVYDEYGRRINKITGSKDGTDYITDYSKGYGGTGNDLVKNEEQAKQQVIQVSTSNPTATKAIRNALSQGISYTDIISTFPEYFK